VIRQANVTTGPQQVNNGVPAPSAARENETAPNKLLEAQHGERMDTGKAGAAIGSNSTLATVGTRQGTEDGRVRRAYPATPSKAARGRFYAS
jgi:hypothetical protein